MSPLASTSGLSSKGLSRILLCVAVVLLTLSSVQGEKIIVCEEGCIYSNITAGIAAAKSGDTLEVHSGTYRENVKIDKPLTFRGIDTGKGRPVVDAGRNGSAITLSADGIVVDGFVVRNALFNGNLCTGIEVASNDNIISNNLAKDNDNGIFLAGFNNNTLLGNNATRNTNGIRLEVSNANIVKDNYVVDNNYGLRLTLSSGNTLVGNRAMDNDYGILLESSDGNTLRDNVMHGNSYNFGAGGVNNVSTSNLVDNKPVYYLIGASEKIINSSSQAGTVYCIDCANVTIKDLILENNQKGILLINTNDSKLENNKLSNNSCGIKLISSSKNVIRYNEIGNNSIDGLSLDGSGFNIIENNTVYRNHQYGLSLNFCENNSITANNISINNNGLGINSSDFNLISEDIIRFNKNNNLLLWNSDDNNISLNILNNSSKGAWLILSFRNFIDSNNVFGNNDGIRLEFSENNTISKNKIGENSNGIAYDRNYTNIMHNNTMLGNKKDETKIVPLTKLIGGGGGGSFRTKMRKSAARPGHHLIDR